MERDFVTVQEAAQIIGVHPAHVRWYFKHGHLSGSRIGAKVLVFSRAEVERFQRPKHTGRPKGAKHKGKTHAK